MGFPAPVAVAATAAFYALLVRTHAPCGVDGSFCGIENGLACTRLRSHLEKNLHGQNVAVDLLSDAICDHLETPNPTKPLVLAVHGPPGVGKSYFHRLAAQAVYGAGVRSEDESEGGMHGNSFDGLKGDEKEETFDGWQTVRSSFKTATTQFANVFAPITNTLFSAQLNRKGDDKNKDNQCPGSDCPGYKIVFGVDYVTTEEKEQSAKLKDSLLIHLKQYPDSVVVIEEYDKMGCAARGMVRQLLEKGHDDTSQFKNSVFILEANAGFTEIKKNLDAEMKNIEDSETIRRTEDARDVSTGGDSNIGRTGDGTRTEPTVTTTLSPSVTTNTQRFLRDLVFSRWADDGCETLVDTKKAVGAIDVFAPFLPLTRNALRLVVIQHLRAKALDKCDGAILGDAALASLTWSEDDSVVGFLISQVELEGRYAVEGGKEVPFVLSRWVTRALRKKALQLQAGVYGTNGVVNSTPQLGGKRVRLEVGTGGKELVAVVVEDEGGAKG